MPRAEIKFFNDRNSKSASTIMLAYLLHGNTIISGRKLGRLTGLGREAVVNATGYLVELGWLVKHPQGFRLNGGMESLFGGRSIESGSHLIDNSGSIIEPLQQLNSHKVVRLSNHQNGSTSPAGARALDLDLDDHDQEIRKKLSTIGFQNASQWLAEQDKDLVANWLWFMDTQPKRSYLNPAAYLRRVVETKQIPPKIRPPTCPECNESVYFVHGECLKCAGQIES